MASLLAKETAAASGGAEPCGRCLFETVLACYAALVPLVLITQAGLKLAVLLPQLLQC